MNLPSGISISLNSFMLFSYPTFIIIVIVFIISIYLVIIIIIIIAFYTFVCIFIVCSMDTQNLKENNRFSKALFKTLKMILAIISQNYVL